MAVFRWRHFAGEIILWARQVPAVIEKYGVCITLITNTS
jgi:hypothetical protein